jgi:hypothetical protein
MDEKGIEAVKGGKVQALLAAGKPRAAGIPSKGKGDFEDLLNRVTRDMAQLREETRQEEGTCAVEGPEDLEAALKEAGRNFSSAMETSRNLIKAYQVTLESLHGDPHSDGER